jgi:hypothetical protein
MKRVVFSNLLALALTATTSAQAPSPAGSLDNYVYTVPRGWTRANYPDGIVYGSPLFNNGERCQISVFPMRPASGNLLTDARNAYRQIFQLDPFQNNAYPYPTATLTRGTSSEGWHYLIIKRSIRGQVGDYGTLLGTRIMAAQVGSQAAVITSTGKDPLVSQCFGDIVHDSWPEFFHSIRFKNWTPAPQGAQVSRELAGTWTTATANVADRYTFAANGRFASAAAAMTTTRLSPTELLQTTNAYFGDGAYAIRGNVMTLVSDSDRGHPSTRWFRIEQDSNDGSTWVDRLCLLQAGVGDVCYTRDSRP